MHHSHLHPTMAHTSQRFPQQNTIHDQMKHPHHDHHYHRREQSSESITSTSRDFNTNHVKKYDSNYPQKQLTRKPRPFTYNEKQNSQSREHSITCQYPYGYLHNIKDNQRKQLTTKEQMYYHKKLSDIQCTNESSGSTSNPNRNELNNHQHLHHLPMATDDSHLHKCEQIQNRLHHMNQKREIYDTRLMQSVGSISANDCHMFSYHPYGFNSPNERSTDWNSPKPQMSTSYTTDSTVGNKFIGQQCQFGLNTLESFQQGCLTSLASMLLCPHTILPIMVGLFSNVGSSTDYVQKLGGMLINLIFSNLSLMLLPISINLSNFSTSTEAAVHLAEKIWISIEHKYGRLPVRLQWASKDVYGIVKLIRGRPFQHPIKKPFYPDLESYTDITLDSCYGNGIRKLYPVSNCIESNQRDTTCFTHGAYYNHGSRQMLESTNKLTSAVSMAAAAAAAAVTAADHHWRQSGNSKYFNHHSQQMYERGELLLNGQSIPNSNHGKLNKKHFLSTHDKQYSKSTRNQQRKTVNIERKKNEQLLRQYVLDACSVLSMLDRRVGGRQTRLILCINGINGTIENSITNKKLLDFMHLLDHILMKPPTGGKSYDVPLILAPIGSPEKVANNIPSTVWVPNAVMIIAANISGINNDNAKMSNFDSVGRNDYHQMHRISSTLRMSLTNSSIGSNPKIWYCIHQLCHLPIYIEDEPFGFKVFDQTNEQSFISPTRSASNIYHPHEKTEVSQPKSLNDLYISKHELIHFNKKRLRHLLTLTAFMGRMIKLDRLYTQRIIHQTNQTSLSYLNALQYFANEPSLNTLMTWLCFITHWPFHAAWLGVFIENYQNCSIKERVNYLLTNHTSRSQPEGLNLTFNDNRSIQFGMEQLGSNLTTLYSRVIER
ncbi:Kinase D-interacting substrate [Schistosoma japonicum]|nr:Kinase D-interacting substrate [Schistosoma japonicum]